MEGFGGLSVEVMCMDVAGSVALAVRHKLIGLVVIYHSGEFFVYACSLYVMDEFGKPAAQGFSFCGGEGGGEVLGDGVELIVGEGGLVLLELVLCLVYLHEELALFLFALV